MTEIRQLDCSCIVLRAVTRSRDFDDEGNVSSVHFVLREGEPGFSVDIADMTTVEATASGRRGTRAVVSLHTGRVRDIKSETSSFELDIVHSPIEQNPAHAEIMGIPQPTMADAEFIAGELARQYKIQWRAVS